MTHTERLRIACAILPIIILVTIRPAAGETVEARADAATDTHSLSASGRAPALELFLHGNTHDGCTGNGAADLSIGGCTPSMSTDPLDNAPAAAWGPISTLVPNCNVARCAADPNWIWELAEPTALEGPMAVSWWYGVPPGTALFDHAFFIRLYADGVLVLNNRVEHTVPAAPATVFLQSIVEVPRTTANQDFVLHIDPAFAGTQDPSFIYYDSQSSCPGATAGRCDSRVVMPIADPTPQPPNARNDNAFALVGGTVVIDVLANDFDPEGGPLTVEITTHPSNGTATVTPGNAILYTHDGSPTQTDAMVYEATDDQDLTDTATVFITISDECVLPTGSFADNFDSGAPGWTVDTSVINPPSQTWALTPDPFATSGVNVWHTDADAQDPLNDTSKDVRLVSPSQAISSSTHLTFWHRFNTEATFDGGVLEVSTDGGGSWEDVIAAGGIFVTGGYNDSINPGSGFVLEGRAAWAGESPDFSTGAMHLVNVNLGALVGETVRVRFRFGQDQLAPEPAGGWWIDDVNFTNLLEPCPDTDADGVGDPIDNCPLTPNEDQMDQDADNVGDVCDNCLLEPNPDQCNTNAGVGEGLDQIGNVCDADLDNNNIVNSFDLTILRSNFGQSGANDADITCNGIVNSFDLTELRNDFGQPPGPSGITSP